MLDKLPGPQQLYLSVDWVVCDQNEEEQNYPLEFINSLTPSGMPEHRLCLKVGSIIMLLRNLNIQRGLCNGTRLAMKEMHENLIIAETIATDRPSDVNLPFVLERRQFPLRLAYSMTIKQGSRSDIR